MLSASLNILETSKILFLKIQIQSRNTTKETSCISKIGRDIQSGKLVQKIIKKISTLPSINYFFLFLCTVKLDLLNCNKKKDYMLNKLFVCRIKETYRNQISTIRSVYFSLNPSYTRLFLELILGALSTKANISCNSEADNCVKCLADVFDKVLQKLHIVLVCRQMHVYLSRINARCCLFNLIQIFYSVCFV